MDEVGELKRAQEMRVDEFSVQKIEKVMMRYRSSLHKYRSLQEEVNCMNYSRDFQQRIDLQWKIISRSQLVCIPSKSSIYVEPLPKHAI